MEVVFARTLADALERALKVRLHEAVELHVRVGGTQPGFQMTCVSAVPRTETNTGTGMMTSIRQGSMARARGVDQMGEDEEFDDLLSFLGAAAARVSHVPDRCTRGFRLVVEGWAPTRYVQMGLGGRAVVDSRVAEAVRARVESLALVHSGVAWTVYDVTTRRFVFKSLRRETSLSKALEFFGVNAELVVSLDDGAGGITDGWRVSGHAVLPPVGHPSRARQLVYINGVLVKDSGCYGDSVGDNDWIAASAVQERIESLYKDAYAGAVKHLPSRPFDGQLAVVRKGLNAHPMFILEICMANRDALREACASGGLGDALADKGGNKGGTVNKVALLAPAALLNMGDIAAAVERAFLLAWSKSLTGRLLKLLETTARQEHSEGPSANEHRIVRVDTGSRGRRRFGVDGCPGPDIPQERESSDHIDSRDSLFDDLEAVKYGIHEETIVDVLGKDVHQDLLSLSKRRRSSQGMDAINAILDGTSTRYTNTASSTRLMPHTTAHSTFATPVVTAGALQAPQPPVTRHDLANATRVLGQIERKFIAFLTPSDTDACWKLAIIDQHAADERVRLELLTGLAVLPDNRPNPTHVHSQALPSPVFLHVRVDEEVLFRTYRHDACAWGWQWEHRVGDSAGIGCHQKRAATVATVVTHVPMLFGRTLFAADLKLYLYQLAGVGCVGGTGDTGDTGGNVNRVVPDAVRRALASLACRSAIMFGDHVSLSEATVLIRNLSCTKQYAECAHGRPTVACLWRGFRGRAKSKSKTSSEPYKIHMPLSDLKAKLVFEVK